MKPRKPRIFMLGTLWWCTDFDTIHRGVASYGGTPAEAYEIWAALAKHMGWFYEPT